MGFVYDGVYLNAGDEDPAFAQPGQGDTEIPAREEVTRWERNAIPLRANEGSLAEGWTISSHHSIKPNLCHLTTASGWTITSESRHFGQNFESNTQKTRSLIRSRGLFVLLFNVASCWRRARFSAARS